MTSYQTLNFKRPRENGKILGVIQQVDVSLRLYTGTELNDQVSGKRFVFIQIELWIKGNGYDFTKALRLFYINTEYVKTFKLSFYAIEPLVRVAFI